MSGQKTLTRRLMVLMLAAGVACWSAVETQAQDDRFLAHTRQLGRAAVEYRDADIHVVAAYYYSQRNRESQWLLIETALSTTGNMVIDRQNITLVTPSGRTVSLPSQARFAGDVNRARSIVQNASATRHDLLSYFNHRDRPEGIRLFALPGGTVLTNFATDVNHVAVGDLFFESPTGSWEPGTYSLVIERDDVRATLPIELE